MNLKLNIYNVYGVILKKLIKSVFKYLGSIIHGNGTCFQDREMKIVRGEQATKVIHGLIENTLTKKRIF